MMRKRLATLACAACLAAALPSAAAQTTNLAQAKTYFNAGVKAYQAGMFPAAIQAFQQAHKLAPKPAILFTIGQAYRRQFYLDKAPDNLNKAINHYRRYVQEDPHGRRRADAAQALAELEPIAEKLKAQQQATDSEQTDGQPPPTAPSRQVVPKTRLMITSPTPGASVSIDKAKGTEAPFIAEVKKGKHHVTVTAPGFFDQGRDVDVAEGAVLALDIVLQPRPSRLLLQTESGAAVSVDGRYVGDTPFRDGIKLEAGTHQVTVLRNGRKAYATRVVTKRGQKLKLKVPLEASTQRVASWVLLSTGGAALIAGGAFTGLSFRAQTDAQNIADRRAKENIGAFDLTDYNDAVDRRDQMRGAAVLGFSSALLFGGIGAWLYAYDNPSAPKLLTTERASEQPKQSAPTSDAEMSVSWTPVVTPGGVGVIGQF